MKMRMVLAAGTLAVTLSSTLAAQPPKPVHKRGNDHGYFFSSVGTTTPESGSTVLHHGAGAYVRVVKGLGFNPELGYVHPVPGAAYGFGVLSANAQYQFGATEAKWRPFAGGGYSLMFRNGVANGINFGGGATYWFRERLGLRMEFRYHNIALERCGFWGVRAGLSLR